jgi:hypothetical protein
MVATPGVEMRHIDGCTVAYQRLHGTLHAIEPAVAAVRSWVVTMGFKPQGPLAIELDREPSDDAAEEYDVEVQLPVPDNAKAHPSDQVQIKPFAPVDAAVLTIHGPFEFARLAEPVAVLRQALAGEGRKGLRIRYVELTDPTKVGGEEQTTEVQYLIG